MTDRRNAKVQDEQNYAQIAREGGLSLSWLVSNRDHAASLHRLIASGRISIAGDGWIEAGERKTVPPRSAWDGLREFLRLCRVYVFGGPSP
jgi:hypothetical protein